VNPQTFELRSLRMIDVAAIEKVYARAAELPLADAA
jgi:hypothetical protein